MNKLVFENMLEKIMAFFARNPTPAIHVVCWRACDKLPDVFADYAVDQAGDLDKMPGNLSKFLKDSWFRWRETHPSMAAREQVFGCDFCHGGIIYFVREIPGAGWSPDSAMCGHCRPTGQTHSNIRRYGGEIVAPSEQLRVCLARNGTGDGKEAGQNYVAQLQDWRAGEQAYERAPIPDDDRQDLAEGW